MNITELHKQRNAAWRKALNTKRGINKAFREWKILAESFDRENDRLENQRSLLGGYRP